MEIHYVLCEVQIEYLYTLQTNQSASHSRDPGSILGQSMWNLWWANRYWDKSFSKHSVFFCQYWPLFVMESEDTYLHCILMTPCTQIRTCSITKSILLNKDQYRTAENMWRERFISVHQLPITTRVSPLLPATISSDINWDRPWPCASHHF